MNKLNFTSPLPLVFGLYVAQGIPLGLIFQAYPAILRQAGVGLEALAWMPMAMLPWLGKLFWASWVENHYSPNLGRRCSWIIPLQLFQLGVLLLLASVKVQEGSVSDNAVALIVGLMIVLGFSSATQDIATDGLAAETCSRSQMPLVNALQVAGFMIGMLVGGPLVMLLADSISLFWGLVFTAAVTAVATLPVMFWQEPTPAQLPVKARLKFFFQRPRSIAILLMSCCLTMTCAVAYNLAKYILLDAGWSLSELGLLSGLGNILMVVFGSIFAAIIMARSTPWFCISVGLAFAFMSLCFWLLMVLGALTITWSSASLAISCGGLAIGLCTSSVYALLMGYAKNGRQPATDFSIFQALQSSSEMAVMTLATVIAANFGFSFALILGLVLFAVVSVIGVKAQRQHWLV